MPSWVPGDPYGNSGKEEAHVSAMKTTCRVTVTIIMESSFHHIKKIEKRAANYIMVDLKR